MTHPSTKPASRQIVSPAARLRFIGSNLLIGVLFALFAYAALRTWQQTGHVQSLILAFQELLIVGLAIIRHYSIVESRSLWDWQVALIGTAAPLLQRAGITLPALEPIGLVLQAIGTLLATFAVISLGRSFGIIAANRGVRTTGFYRFVRHPLYGSYMIGYLGFLLGNLSFWNVSLIVLTVLCQYARAVAEERILLLDPAYQAYVQRVRYRFIPYIF
ncbi:MAG: methyltransferase family protein [Roseiflexaceae bacterium]